MILSWTKTLSGFFFRQKTSDQVEEEKFLSKLGIPISVITAKTKKSRQLFVAPTALRISEILVISKDIAHLFSDPIGYRE